MGGDPDDEFARDMSGVSIDITSPDIVSREGMLILMKHLLDEKWISIIKENYRLIRSLPKPNNILRLPPKLTHNAPCPCGSGRKYKNCCI